MNLNAKFKDAAIEQSLSRNMADCIVACDTAAEEKGKAESKLIAALRKAKRTSIKVKGINLLLSHIGPKDKITAQKPK